ncbi:MFS transporter [Paenibacillus baekrokdamisoli]|uniref:MFS-type drug efflux transporter P55 n=1 Tax=Paenibacillus baekrokdamisoli TaxID=1712516 RepID=A0A3G9JJN8_9BACL|nr:MFS transporter [Paenibacillus baekrokdamisoli]MBB3072324.1 EmrB/QacA subfamily drug resistance transporter [Paenibacillus baekrokdamisoli]BBH23194.1 MFS transporter [Paenibacillus baekrokdamisoli]
MNNRLVVMISIVLAMLVASMDSTIINTTMPIIVKDLGGRELYAWVFTAYMIASTVLSPLAGRMSDLFGRKTIFGIGILLFMGGSLLCGFSHTMVQLVIYRAIQGIGAGIMLPFPAILAGDLFPVEQRGKIQAFFTAMWGLSAVLAPLLGTFFVEYLNWHWIFFVNIPICLISFLALLPYKEVYQPKKSSIDILGALLFAGGVSLLLATTIVSHYIILYAVGGAALIVAFFFYEKSHPSPIVPLSLLRNRPIAWMLAGSFLSYAALFGASSFIPLFVQNQGYSLLISGVALLFVAAGWMALSVPAGKWVLRYGYKRLLIIANSILVFTAVLMLILKQSTPLSYIFLVMTVFGLAYGLLSTVSIIGSQQLVEPHQKGISTSLQMFARNIGTAVGVTLMGAFITKADNFFVGMGNLFLFGFILSAAAIIPPLALRGQMKESVKSGS